MADYAIGDVQGCYDALQRLLTHVRFDEKHDRLWFVGDLVNRGPQSLETLRFIHALPIPPRITLGNHDLHFLSRLFAKPGYKTTDDTLQSLLNAPDAEALGHWLRQQPMLYYDASLGVVMAHAGIAPCWGLEEALACAKVLEHVLSGDEYVYFFKHMYGNEGVWSRDLTGISQWRTICNYFTRMRFCDGDGQLNLTYKGTLAKAPEGLYPWYVAPKRRDIQADILFGHWAALAGEPLPKHIYGLDTGCVWGGTLTALRLQDRQLFSVPGL